MQEVKLPKEVCEAISFLQESFPSNGGLIGYLHSNYEYGPNEARAKRVINRYAHTDDNFNNIMTALLFGFEEEISPEDRVKKLYDQALESSVGSDTQKYYFSGVQFGIEETLRHFGVKIEGIN